MLNNCGQSGVWTRVNTTTPHIPTESSVLLAFAELDRLERARAGFVADKHAARAKLTLQADQIDELRARIEAERPRAWARIRRADAERRSARERAAAEALAAAELAHRERLVRIEAELEAKRLRLAALESNRPVARPGRRVLEWSVPMAASVLVAFLGFTLLGEDAAEAAAPAALIESDAPAMEPAFGPLVPLAAVEVAPAPEPAAEVSEPEPSKPKASKPKASKPKTSEPKASEPKKHSNPLIIGDFGGNPLG